MRKRYTKRGSVGKASRKQRRKRQAGENRTVQLVLDREELVAMMQDSLTDFATEMGLKVASLLLEDEVHQRCGSRYERVPERTVTRYGPSTRGGGDRRPEAADPSAQDALHATVRRSRPGDLRPAPVARRHAPGRA